MIFYTPIAMIILFVAFSVVIFPINFVALFFPKQSTRLKITQWFWGILGHIIIRLVCLAKFIVIDKRDEASKRRGIPRGLYIANHSSYLDIPALLCCFRVPPIMKKEVLYVPVFGLLGYASGAIVLNRSSSNSRKQVFEVARARLTGDDGCMQYYPEGTRNKLGNGPKELKEIKTRIMSLAYELNVPLYPVSIFGTDIVLNRYGFCRFFKPVGVYLHAGLNPQDFLTEEEFVKKAWDLVREGYQQLEFQFKQLT